MSIAYFPKKGQKSTRVSGMTIPEDGLACINDNYKFEPFVKNGFLRKLDLPNFIPSGDYSMSSTGKTYEEWTNTNVEKLQTSVVPQAPVAPAGGDDNSDDENDNNNPVDPEVIEEAKDDDNESEENKDDSKEVIVNEPKTGLVSANDRKPYASELENLSVDELKELAKENNVSLGRATNPNTIISKLVQGGVATSEYFSN